MNKIISLTLFGGIMVVEMMATVISYLLAMIYLVFADIVGTKPFRTKFKKLNKGVVEQIKSISKTYKKILDRV